MARLVVSQRAVAPLDEEQAESVLGLCPQYVWGRLSLRREYGKGHGEEEGGIGREGWCLPEEGEVTEKVPEGQRHQRVGSAREIASSLQTRDACWEGVS